MPTHPRKSGNLGKVQDFFSVLEFVLEFTIFRVLSWKCHQIFFVQFTIFFFFFFFTFIISVFYLYFMYISYFVLYFLSLCILTTLHVINNFSLQKMINMAKRNCTLNNDWLIEFEWVERGSNAQRTAYCKLFHHTFDISNMGKKCCP